MRKRVKINEKVRSPDQRENILRTAIHLISKKGIHETSFQMIADECDLSQTAILYYFKSKEVLIEEMVKHVRVHNYELLASNLSLHDDALTRLQKHFKMNLTWALEFPEEAQIIVLLYYYASFNPRFAEYYKGVQKAAQDRIKEYLLAGIREKLFSSKLDVDSYSVRLHELLLGAFVNALTLPVADRAKRMKELVSSWNKFLPAFLSSSQD